MNQREEVWKIIFSLSSLFRKRCALCRAKCHGGKGWLIHHRKYLEKGDVIWSEYKKAGKTRLQYYTDLEPLVRKNPKRFRLLMNPCHHALTNFVRWKKSNRKRMTKLANEMD